MSPRGHFDSPQGAPEHLVRKISVCDVAELGNSITIKPYDLAYLCHKI